MPDLVGLSEIEALTQLSALGFKVDSVLYSASTQATGTVVAQSHKAGDMLAEQTAVSFTVSAGIYFESDD